MEDRKQLYRVQVSRRWHQGMAEPRSQGGGALGKTSIRKGKTLHGRARGGVRKRVFIKLISVVYTRLVGINAVRVYG